TIIIIMIIVVVVFTTRSGTNCCSRREWRRGPTVDHDVAAMAGPALDCRAIGPRGRGIQSPAIRRPSPDDSFLQINLSPAQVPSLCNTIKTELQKIDSNIR